MDERRRERQFPTGIGNVLFTKTLGKYLIPFRLRNPAYCVWAPKRDKAHLQHLRERKRTRMMINHVKNELLKFRFLTLIVRFAMMLLAVRFKSRLSAKVSQFRSVAKIRS